MPLLLDDLAETLSTPSLLLSDLAKAKELLPSKQPLVVAGTGHRPDKLGPKPQCYSDGMLSRLTVLAYRYLQILEPDKVITGMALGWDTALALAALELEIPLVCAIPFRGQELSWPETAQKRYNSILKQASKVTIVSKGSYSLHKMQRRNEWMVDRCDLVLALWNGSSGGTQNCINYAESKNKAILNAWYDWQVLKHTDQRQRQKRPGPRRRSTAS